MPASSKHTLIQWAAPFALALSLIAPSAAQAESTAPHWKDIEVGGRISIGVKTDGTVWAWGESNQTGAFGNGEMGEQAANSKVPVQVKGLTDVLAVAAGSDHGLAVKKDGTVWAWGDNTDGQIGDGTETKREEGSGKVIEDHSRAVPVQVLGLSHVVSVWASWARSYAIKDDGTLWAWGSLYYRDSDGTIKNYTTPVQLRFENVVSISTGYGDNLLVLEGDGTVWTLSRGNIVQIEGLKDIQAVAAAGADSYALQKDGTVWMFGSDGQGVIAGEDTSKKSAPQKVDGIRDVIDIRATGSGPLYLKKDHTVWASGKNSGGQLGIGSFEDSDVPVQVKGLGKIVKIAAHGTGMRSGALREDGTLWTWGNGYTGDGTEWYRTEPVWIPASSDEPAPPSDLISVQVDGKTLAFDQQPIILEGSTFVPLRAIFETLGAKVAWDSASSTVTATKGNNVISLTVGEQTATLNGQSIELESPATIVNGHTLVPVRFIAESLGAKVEWKAATATVAITTH